MRDKLFWLACHGFAHRRNLVTDFVTFIRISPISCFSKIIIILHCTFLKTSKNLDKSFCIVCTDALSSKLACRISVKSVLKVSDLNKNLKRVFLDS